MKYISNNLEETEKIANDFLSRLSPNSNKAIVVGLYGELGVGKTTFAQGLANAMGVKDNVTSPTFVLEKIYELINQKFAHLIHIDAYRLEKSQELLHLGWQEIISDHRNLVLIEWPEKVADIMPDHIKIKFSHVSENSKRSG